ncbi:MAG: SIS domain-containing protein [Bacillota bacterium]
MDTWLSQGLDHLHLVGCGGSLATFIPPKWLLDRFSPLPVDVNSGWEFVHRQPARLNARSAAILASHSGTTEEILVGLDLAKSRGAHTLSFSKPGTPLTQGAKEAMTYNSPATNLSKLLMGYQVATELIGRLGDKGAAAELRQALAALPAGMESVRAATEEWGKEMARKYKGANQFYVVGTGLLAGLSYQFVTCNLLEMHWIHAAPLNAAEFRHGPFEIVDKDLPMIFLLGNDESRPVAERALAFAQRHGADTIVVDLKELPGNIHPWLAAFGVHLPLQWFNWCLGEERNHPTSTRRYMGVVPY